MIHIIHRRTYSVEINVFMFRVLHTIGTRSYILHGIKSISEGIREKNSKRNQGIYAKIVFSFVLVINTFFMNIK